MFETTFPENAYTTYEIVVFAGIGKNDSAIYVHC